MLENLRDELRKLSGLKFLQKYRSVTFITKKIPWGFGYPNFHDSLFSYPDLVFHNKWYFSELADNRIRVSSFDDQGKYRQKKQVLQLRALGIDQFLLEVCYQVKLQYIKHLKR